ncbi:hypothetical protein V2J92_21965 [Pseudomonas alliivorans]|nr:hypothetical protein [Pseudomonas alliivorans]MEE5171595.1 hypothetical protein [Pseudomonas alliivorans]
MAAVETNDLEEFLADLEIEWFYSTKEQLSPADVFAGLLKHGLGFLRTACGFSSAVDRVGGYRWFLADHLFGCGH